VATRSGVRARHARHRVLGIVGLFVCAVLGLSALASNVYAELLPLPHRVANGGYATDLELPPNTIENVIEWSGSPGVSRDVEIDWGDGNFETLTGVVSPHVIRHTYAATGPYQVSVRVLGEPFGLKFFDVAILDIPEGAEAKIISPLVNGSNRFGTAVAYDGVRAAVGAGPEPTQTTRYGRVHTYLRDGSQWTFEQTLTAPTQVQGAEFGSSVALDGTRMAVGASSDKDAAGNTVGALYIYEFGGSGWTHIQKLQPDVLLAGDSFGTAIALEGDHLVVGASGDDGAASNGGAVYLYERGSDGVWALVTTLTDPFPQDFDSFGSAVDLHGGLLVVGAPGFSSDGTINGTVHLYRWETSVPTTPVDSILGYVSNVGTGAGFGAAVAIGANDLIVIGAPKRVAAAGQTHGGTITVLQLIGSDLTVLDTLNPPAGVTGLGMAVDIDGERVAGHAWGAVDGRDTFVFEPDGGLANWVQVARFVPTDGSSWGIGGPTNRRVVIVGDRVISADDFDTDAQRTGWETGAAYVWTLTPQAPQPIQLTVRESIVVDDQSEVTPGALPPPPPVQIIVTESIAVDDTTDVTVGAEPVPAVRLLITETIAVDDTPDVSLGAAPPPPLDIVVAEIIEVIEGDLILSLVPPPLPPIDVTVTETIQVIDGDLILSLGPPPLPPIDVAVSETIQVIDGDPILSLGPPPLSPIDVSVTETVVVMDVPGIETPGDADDGDGIAPEVDGYSDETGFVDESAMFSDRFTDQPLGGTTFGEIVDRADETVEVSDAANLADGVLVTVGGSSSDASLEFCGGYGLALPAGTIVIVTCGSLTTEVLAGAAAVTLEDGTVVDIPQGATVEITERDDEGWDVAVLAGNGVTVTADGQTYDLDEGDTWPGDGDANAPPVADAAGPYLVAAGEVVVLDGSASLDPDGDALTYAWSAPGASLDDPSSITPAFSAAEAGVYTVTLEVCDPSGACDEAEASVVVYDPSAGFVTGGGWIHSPAGACGDAAPEGVCDGDPTGRATFAFVSRYKKGASSPDGQTEFLFQAANLRFHSTSYEWLVVAGRDRAQFKGAGSVNGVGGFEFMLMAYDGGDGGDGFRIRIWNDDGLVYDNRVDAGDAPTQGNTQPIDGGSIVIHAR
jgi:hypothetical protein